MTPAIEFRDVSFSYPGADQVLRDVNLRVEEGELALVIGPTGAGKSTLLRAAGALVPHFTGGSLGGTVRIAGRDTRDHLPRDLADVVGVVGQDPAAGFVTDRVADELAYAMEQLGVPNATMARRVEEILDLLGLAGLRDRVLADLSGGEQQRVAIGAVLTAQPRILVLDEPTSALDPGAAEEVLAALTRLVHDLGLTVLLAEHRLERVVQYADRVITVHPGGRVSHGAPAQQLAAAPLSPPIVELGRLIGWQPLPLSVRDARRRGAELRAVARPLREASGAVVGQELLTARQVQVRHQVPAVRGVSLTLHAGEVVAVMGRNGSGKTSLIWALQGGPRSGGTVLLPSGEDPARLSPSAARRQVALVPHDPLQLLYLDTVASECRESDRQAAAGAGTTARLLAELSPQVPPDAHPRDLSEGQRLALALAIQLAADPPVLLLDEPTRGLDYGAKRRLGALLAARAARGAVLLSSHDVEFLAECATRVVLLADGVVVAQGSAREILLASPTFAPQVARIMHPLPMLTIADLQRALP